MGADEPQGRRYQRLWGADARRDSDEELAFHFEAHVRDLMQGGMTRTDAEGEARRVFGDVQRIRSELQRIGDSRNRRVALREQIGRVLSDLRIALRTLMRRPAYAAAAVLTLGIGVGAAAAVFSVVDSMLLRPLPWPGAEQMVALWERNVPRSRDRNVVSVPAFEGWREQATSYAATAGLVPDRSTLTDRDPERVYGAAVSPEWFEVTGVRPRLGRAFTTGEAVQEPLPIVLSDGLWRDRFGADETIIDRTIDFGGTRYRVAGVMPPGFEPPSFGWLEEGQRYWVPFMPDAENRQWGRFLLVLGRLRPGLTPAAADAELERIAAGPGEFDERDEWSAEVVGLRTEITGSMHAQAIAVAVAVGLLLLISIANVAGVVLARARSRAAELRMRVALGASRGALARQLLAEGGAIALLSVPVAALLAVAGVQSAIRLLPSDLPRLDDVTVSWTAAAVCGLVLVLATLVLGLAPLVRRADAAAAPSSASRVVRGGDGALLTLEIALALALTTGAVLATRSVLNMTSVDPGYDAESLVASRLSLTAGDASDDARRLAAEQLERLLATDPAIDQAGLVSFRPLYGGNPATGVVPHGSDVEPVVSDVLVATPRYFTAAGIDVLEGRLFSDVDVEAVPPVLINRTLARQLGGATAIGTRIIVRLNDPFMEGVVVGVLDDVRLAGPLVDPRATVYFRHRDWPVNTLDVVARASTTTPQAASAVRRAVRELDPHLAVWEEAELEASLRSVTARERSLAAVLSLFSIVALTLAAAGVYAAAAVRAASRRREFSVRVALGASPARLSGSVLRETLLLGIPGVLAGSLIIPASSGLLRRVLFGIEPADALTIAATAALLMAVVLLASAIPAWRASRTDPADALRGE